MFGEQVTQAAKQADEIAYLKIILDSLVRRQSLFEMGGIDLDRQFLRELKHSVDSALRVDCRVKEGVRTKVLSAFNLLIDNSCRIH